LKKILTPWKIEKNFDPFRNFPFTTPLGSFNLAPTQKLRISDPLRKISWTGGCGY
jgi:hypothetical protein